MKDGKNELSLEEELFQMENELGIDYKDRFYNVGNLTKASDKAEDVVFQNFRRNLQILRVAKGLSTEKLAEMINAKSKKRVIDMEYGQKGRGYPKMDEIVLLSKIFNVSTDDLLTKKAAIIFL